MTQPPTAVKKSFVPSKWLVWIGLFIFLGFLALGLFRSQNRSLAPGADSPAFTLKTFDGQEIRSSELAGKIVVVNFWASWCTPCEDEAEDLEQAYKTFRDRGVVFLGIDYVDTEPEARAYLEKFQITYPNGADLGTRISQAFRTRGVPETYIFDEKGRLVHVQIGPFNSQRQIDSILNQYLPEDEG